MEFSVKLRSSTTRRANATAKAVTDASVVPVGEKQFLFLVRETPFFALNVMRVLARRLIAANKML